MTTYPANAYALHEKALKTASALKYVVVPLADNSPRPATFVRLSDGGLFEIVQGHEPCVFSLPTAYELVRNLKASRGWICSCISEADFHRLALKSLAGNPHAPATE